MSEHQRMIIGRVTFGAGGNVKDVKYVSKPPFKPADAIQPLAWTSTPPSVPGWYCWGNTAFRDFALRRYTQQEIDAFPEDFGGAGFIWLGPLPEPTVA